MNQVTTPPFTADDALNRKEYAETIVSYLRNKPASTTVLISSPYGTGKSFILNMVKESWESEPKSGRVVWFDTWKNDYYDDPLVPLIGTLAESLPKDIPLTKACRLILQPVIKTLASMLTTIDYGFTRALTESILDEKEEVSNPSKHFKKQLEEYARIQKENHDLPLLFIIDDLDRCTPRFALRVLERIKHYFDVPNVVFLIAADFNQLSTYVRKVYGKDTDAEGYLLRTIDVQMSLPQSVPSQLLTKMAGRFPDLFRTEGLVLLASHLFETKQMSLRDFEKWLPITMMAQVKMNWLPSEIIFWFIYLRYRHPLSYTLWLNRTPLGGDMHALAEHYWFNLPQFQKNHRTSLLLFVVGGPNLQNTLEGIAYDNHSPVGRRYDNFLTPETAKILLSLNRDWSTFSNKLNDAICLSRGL
jgi:hypothetical protein